MTLKTKLYNLFIMPGTNFEGWPAIAFHITWISFIIGFIFGEGWWHLNNLLLNATTTAFVCVMAFLLIMLLLMCILMPFYNNKKEKKP